MSPTARLTDAQRARLSRIPLRSGAAAAAVDLSRFPDFLIIGPQRSGTTWLHHHLFRHPAIFLPRRKEIYFFSRLGREVRSPGVETLEDYLERAMTDSPLDWARKTAAALARSGCPYRPTVRGESTATYAILEPEVIREILALNPGLKAVMMLRDPVARAWSHARKDLFADGVPGEADAFPLEEFRKFCRAAGQTQLARYSGIIENWSAHLEPGHLFLARFDDIAARPEALVATVQRFLGVPAGRRYMDRGKLASRINPAPEAPIPPAAREFLREQLAGMVEDYEAILRDLPPLS
ncbi:MAG: sulfotransferase [Verrucomicrobiae bacterium]|nr:sulfotransferase [Verrucomicrobiae bacterium]MCP5541901.1 sulfotransferase [Akkermansiaceae bacterium]